MLKQDEGQKQENKEHKQQIKSQNDKNKNTHSETKLSEKRIMT